MSRLPTPWTIRDDDSLVAVVEMMERRHIKRLLVTRDGRMVGIVSRANLMHALATFAHDLPAPAGGDSVIRANILAAIAKQDWAPHINVIVRDGIAELHGIVTGDRERQGLVVAAENVAGVKKVHDHLVCVEPTSGMAFPSAEDETKERAAS
jgi:BON domain/CBS domain